MSGKSLNLTTTSLSNSIKQSSENSSNSITSAPTFDQYIPYAPNSSTSTSTLISSPTTHRFDSTKFEDDEILELGGITSRSSIDDKQNYYGGRIWNELLSLNESGNHHWVQSWRNRFRTLKENWIKSWNGEGFAAVNGFYPRPASMTLHTPQQIQQHRLVILIYYGLILLVFLSLGLFFYLPPKIPAFTSAQMILKSSSYEGVPLADKELESYRRSANQAKILQSYSNPYGFSNLIDPYAGGVFNPSVLVLPDTVGIGFRHLLVARGLEKYELIDGEDTRWESIVGCFLLPIKRKYLELPYLARESDLVTLDLPAERKMVFERCDDPSFNQFIGAEDPRLFFTNIGQPLLIYSQTGNSPNICRAIFIIDARVVVPGLSNALSRGGWSPPIEFKEQTPLIREDQTNIEKNWAPFLGENDELFFHVSLIPQKIYKYVPGHALRHFRPISNSSNLPSTTRGREGETYNSSHNCLSELVGADMDRVKFHHASPLLRVTLCKRGECKPSFHNTVLFAIIHIKYHPLPYLYYERRVVTWNVTSPYEYISVSKPLTYSGTNQADPLFTVSMSWDHPTKKNGLGLNHGYLDDVLITSFGVSDYGSAYIDVLARDLLTDHTLCEGTEGSSLW